MTKEDVKKEEKQDTAKEKPFSNAKEENNSKRVKAKTSKKGNKTSKLEAKVEDLEIQVKEKEDKFLRLYSEFDNFRKRTSRERVDLLKNASMETIAEILPVLDDFERAIENMSKEDKDKSSFSEGIQLIYNKLKSILTAKGLKEMEALHQEFDSDIHEAVTQIPAEKEELKGKVVDVIEKGYYLNEKVLRFAKVVVGQ